MTLWTHRRWEQSMRRQIKKNIDKSCEIWLNSTWMGCYTNSYLATWMFNVQSSDQSTSCKVESWAGEIIADGTVGEAVFRLLLSIVEDDGGDRRGKLDSTFDVPNGLLRPADETACEPTEFEDVWLEVGADCFRFNASL